MIDDNSSIDVRLLAMETKVESLHSDVRRMSFQKAMCIANQSADVFVFALWLKKPEKSNKKRSLFKCCEDATVHQHP